MAKAKKRVEPVVNVKVNKIETLRHLEVFKAESEWGNKRINIIGVGATGSRIALSLAKLGVKNIHIYDYDKVESHNIANQAYVQADIGKLKVDAAYEHIKAATGLEVERHPEAVTGKTPLSGVVFLLTDTMKSRKEIWQGVIKFKPSVTVMIETRMASDEGRVYTINPIDVEDIKFWEATLFDDEEIVPTTACGSSISVGPTAEAVSAYAVWALINWFDNSLNKKGAMFPDRELSFGLRPPAVFTRTVTTKKKTE